MTSIVSNSHCRLIGKQVLVYADSSVAGCAYQSKCVPEGRDCVFCRRDGAFQLEYDMDSVEISREIDWIKEHGGTVGVVSYGEPPSFANFPFSPETLRDVEQRLAEVLERRARREEGHTGEPRQTRDDETPSS